MKRRLHSLALEPAFTLVELLVVIGIIALLIGILLPALSKARDSSQITACLANLRSIGQSAQNYAADNHGWALNGGWRNGTSGAYGNAEGWPNILVNSGYCTAPDSTNKGPQTASVFYCPGGVADRVASIVADTVPVSRVDIDGASGQRYKSTTSGTSVDSWYGINASTGNGDIGSVPVIRCPADGDADGNDRAMTRITTINHPSETVLIFDGLFMNHMGVNANRLNARHAKQTKTNLLFFDGHADTYETKTLPGGMPSAVPADFSVANLDAKNPPPSPRWRLNQN